MTSPLAETWEINDRIGLYLLAAIDPAAVNQAPPKGRTIGQQFAHLHNVRLDWLKSGNPALLKGLEKLDTKAAVSSDELALAMTASGERVTALISEGEDTGRIKGFKPHPTAFVGYMVAHDAYHRGEIGMIATAIGFPIDKKTSFGIWEWGVR